MRQVEAIAAARKGSHVMLTTATSSGKSLCFLLPILETLLALPSATAVLLFPTKALAHDQMRVLRGMQGSGWLGGLLTAMTVDGDAGPADRDVARERANVILTNPDTLHAVLLPQHDKWRRFLTNLRFVINLYAHFFG